MRCLGLQKRADFRDNAKLDLLFFFFLSVYGTEVTTQGLYRLLHRDPFSNLFSSLLDKRDLFSWECTVTALLQNVQKCYIFVYILDVVNAALCGHVQV